MNTTTTANEYVAFIDVKISSDYWMAHHLPVIAGSEAEATAVAEGRLTDAMVGYGGQSACVLDVWPLDKYNKYWSQHINHRDIPHGAIIEED